MPQYQEYPARLPVGNIKRRGASQGDVEHLSSPGGVLAPSGRQQGGEACATSALDSMKHSGGAAAPGPRGGTTSCSESRGGQGTAPAMAEGRGGGPFPQAETMASVPLISQGSPAVEEHQVEAPSKELGALVSTGVIVAAQGGELRSERLQKQRKRLELRKVSQQLTSNRGHKNCGQPVDMNVKVGTRDGKAGFGGLQYCGKVHICAWCSSIISMSRAGEVEQAVAYHQSQGGEALFQTLTLPHDMGMRLGPLRKTVADGWRYVTGNRAWKRLKKKHGLDCVKSLEVTVGRNGWHPHLHVLLFLDGPVTGEEFEAIRDHIFTRWRAFVERQGYRPPEQRRCVIEKVKDAQVGGYVAKMGFEMAGAGKEGREGQRTPWQVLDDYRLHGRDGDRALWEEYEAAMFRTNKLTWSRGLKARLLVEEKTDEEILEEKEALQHVATVRGKAYRDVSRHPRLLVRMLDAAEKSREALGELLEGFKQRFGWSADPLLTPEEEEEWQAGAEGRKEEREARWAAERARRAAEKRAKGPPGAVEGASPGQEHVDPETGEVTFG